MSAIAEISSSSRRSGPFDLVGFRKIFLEEEKKHWYFGVLRISRGRGYFNAQFLGASSFGWASSMPCIYLMIGDVSLLDFTFYESHITLSVHDGRRTIFGYRNTPECRHWWLGLFSICRKKHG